MTKNNLHFTERQRREATFIGKGEPSMIRLGELNADIIIRAANALGARFVVVADGWSEEKASPVWAVFDMRKRTKQFGESVLPIASKEFATPTADPAVMWAVAMQGID